MGQAATRTARKEGRALPNMYRNFLVTVLARTHEHFLHDHIRR
jgi:hypothetical protein